MEIPDAESREWGQNNSFRDENSSFARSASDMVGFPPRMSGSRSPFQEKIALVTGAGSGIGRETALALAAEGAHVIVCDIHQENLNGTAAMLPQPRGAVLSRRVDVSDREAMRDFAALVHEKFGSLDILINNAGVALGGTFTDTSLEDWDWIVGINLWGVIYGCHFFIPPMIAARRGGHIVNVASAAGYATTESLAAYGTTKFGVVGLSEALRIELAPHGIGVTAVCPGLINTPITETARLVGTYAHGRSRLVSAYRRRNYGPRKVATGILKAISANRAVAPISPEAWLLYYLKRISPGILRWIQARASARLRRELGGARSVSV